MPRFDDTKHFDLVMDGVQINGVMRVAPKREESVIRTPSW